MLFHHLQEVLEESQKEGIKAIYETSKIIKGKVGVINDGLPAITVGEENLNDLITDIGVNCYNKEVVIEIKIRVTL